MEKCDKLPEFYTGSPVDSTDLQFRSPFISELWKTLKNNHILLTAPRRTGKTSVMDYMRKNPEENYQVVSINVQDLTYPEDFFLTLIDAFQEDYPNFFKDKIALGWQFIKNTLSKVSDVEYAGFKVKLRECDPEWHNNWRKHGEEFLRQIRKHDNRILFIIDELPDMILNMKKKDPELLRDFLAWFRIQRQKPHPQDDPVRWLVGGSVNLSGTLDSLGYVDLINDFDIEELPILTDENIEEFVRNMLDGRNVLFNEDVPQKVRLKLGRPIPLFMQMATQDLYRLWKSKNRRLNAGDVTSVFFKLITQSSARDKLQHFYSRIREYYQEPKRSTAYELLSKMSLSKNGLGSRSLFQEFERIIKASDSNYPKYERKQIFNSLLVDLENDFYVTQTDRHYDFASGILKLWWRKYYA